ncbi:MAG: MFS transporter [Candidatus Heimdallarchaeota archaeon]|nr:MFS transporter [Candidatus Heimdallarchaeota archaeon]
MAEPDTITEQKTITPTTIIELAKVEEAVTTSKRNILFWAFYDAADTVFAMAIISITLYQWGELIGMKQGYSFDQAHVMVSTFLMISNIIVAILLPILGAHSDIVGKRKLMVLIFGGTTILLTPLIALSSRFLLGLFFLLVANVCYQAGNLYYESMLPYICSTESRAKVSAFGVAFGYVGTIFSILLIFILPIIFGNATRADDVINNIVAPEDIQLNFVFWMFFFAALFYFLLLIPFLWVKEKYNESKEKLAISRQIKSTFIQLGRTFKEIFTENKGMLLFLLGWFLINDAVGTCIAILVDYLREGVGFSEMKAGLILFVGIIIGIGFLYIMGPIIDKRGPRFGIIITTVAWAVGITLAVLAGVTYKTTIDLHDGSTIIIHKMKMLAYFASIVLSFGMGAIWVIARQYILELAPPKKIGQYMGLKKISGKASAAMGPLIFSLILSASLHLGKTIAYQIAILSLMGTFIIGFIILLFIKNNHKRYLDGERFPYKKEEKALE